MLASASTEKTWKSVVPKDPFLAVWSMRIRRGMPPRMPPVSLFMASMLPKRSWMEFTLEVRIWSTFPMGVRPGVRKRRMPNTLQVPDRNAGQSYPQGPSMGLKGSAPSATTMPEGEIVPRHSA